MNKRIAQILLVLFAFSASACKEAEELAGPVQCQSAQEVATVLSSSTLSSSFNWDANSGEPLELNPDTLRVLLFNGNMNLLQAANRVHQAKGMLTMARANLLPSINLGVLLSSAANPTFLLASVEFALPFLLPSKWFDMYSKKNLFKAEEMSFLLAELNQYSSMYALYTAMQSDFTIRDFLSQDIQDALTVERLVRHSYEIGQASSADLDLARSQVIAAESRELKLEELLAEEMASLRYALAICPEVPLTLAGHELPPSQLENMTAYQAATEVMETAPEATQMKFLIRAAELERWSKIFSFLGGASISGTGSATQNAFSNIETGRGGANLGFGYAVGISLSNLAIDSLRLREVEIGSEVLKAMDSTLSRIGLIGERIEKAATTEQLLQNVFESEKRRYMIGDTTLLSLTDAQSKLRGARLEQIKADSERKLERLTLHRFTRDEIFTPIQGCAGNQKDPRTLVNGIDPCDSDFVKRKLGGLPKKEKKAEAAPASAEAAS